MAEGSRLGFYICRGAWIDLSGEQGLIESKHIDVCFDRRNVPIYVGRDRRLIFDEDDSIQKESSKVNQQ